MRTSVSKTPVSIGKYGEEIATQYLMKSGYKILDRNFRIRRGEIDIVARFGSDFVFVEVKTRSSNVYGYPEESVGATKTHRIAVAMQEYMRRKRIDTRAFVRFDIIAIDFDLQKNTHALRHLKNIELPT